MEQLKDMRLHCGIGPNSYRVRIFMAEKGIDVPRVDVDLMTAEHRSAEFRKLNSLAQIPVLVLADGTVITESVAICRYLEELHPSPALFGTDAISRAKVEMWNRRAEFEIFGTIGNIALHTAELFKDRLVQFPAFAETQRDAAPGKWAWLDRELDDGRAVSGRRSIFHRRHHRRGGGVAGRLLRRRDPGFAGQCAALARPRA